MTHKFIITNFRGMGWVAKICYYVNGVEQFNHTHVTPSDDNDFWTSWQEAQNACKQTIKNGRYASK